MARSWLLAAAAAVAAALLPSVPVLGQVPTPYFSLTASTDPTGGAGAYSVAQTFDYDWRNVDNGDAACGLQSTHSGLLVFPGGSPYNPTVNNSANALTPYETANFVNLSATAGPNYVGQTLGVVGGGTAGWSFEITMKPGQVANYAKVMDLGNTRVNTVAGGGQCNNDILFGWSGTSLQYQLDVCDASSTQYQILSNNITPGAWVHFVLVFQYVNSGFATNSSVYQIYQNGALVATLNNTYYPPAVQRPNGNLGLSGWPGDQQWSGLLDTFNVYSQSLTQAQVTSAYTAAMGSASTYMCSTAYTASTVQPGATFYSATFDSDPRSLAGGASSANYGWVANDTNDSPSQQAVHQGLILFTTLATSSAGAQWVDLRQTSGPDAAVSTPIAPSLGGLGTGSIGDGTMGWTFEIMYKPFQQENAAKMFDLSDNNFTAAGDWDIIHGYAGTNPYAVFNVFGPAPSTVNATGAPVNSVEYAGSTQYKLTQSTPTLAFNSTWYHIVLSVQYNVTAATASGNPQATYYAYTNGALYTTYSAGLVPPFVQRAFAFLGRSSYAADAEWTGEIDFFRVYSVALNANQASALYTTATTVAAPVSSSSGAASGPSSSAAASGSSSSGMSSSVSAGASSSTPSSSGTQSAASSSSSSLSSSAGVVVIGSSASAPSSSSSSRSPQPPSSSSSSSSSSVSSSALAARSSSSSSSSFLSSPGLSSSGGVSGSGSSGSSGPLVVPSSSSTGLTVSGARSTHRAGWTVMVAALAATLALFW